MRHTVLVLLHYHNDPDSLLASFESLKIANRHFENWRVAILDTAQDEAAEDVLAQEIKELPGKTTFYTNKLTDFQAISTGGMLGICLNRMIYNNVDADIVTYLEDGNIIHPKLLSNLDWFFNYRPKLACYCHASPFDPDKPFVDQTLPQSDYYLNHYRTEINPTGILELGQLAWKTDVHWQFKLWFAWPTLRGPVNEFMKHLYYRTGSVAYAGFLGYYKAERKNDIGTVERDVINCKLARANSFFKRGDYLQAKVEYADIIRMDQSNKEAKVMFEVADRHLGVRVIATTGDYRA